MSTYTTREAAAVLRVSPVRVRQLAAAGVLEADRSPRPLCPTCGSYPQEMIFEAAEIDALAVNRASYARMQYRVTMTTDRRRGTGDLDDPDEWAADAENRGAR